MNDLFVARYNADGTVAWAKQTLGTAAVVGPPATAQSTVDPAGIAGYADGTTVIAGSYAGMITFGPGEAGSTILNSGGFFLARYNADGTVFSATSAGSAGSVTTRGIANVVSDGGTIVTGDFTAATPFGSTTLTPQGTRDAFVVKYNADGTTVAWATSARGPGATVSGAAIATFSDGSSVVGGGFTSTVTFGGNPGAPTLTAAGTQDVFVARYNADGTVAWATQAGAPGASGSAFGIATFADGTSVAVGAFNNMFAFGSGAGLMSAGGDDVFVARYTATGALASARSSGGVGDDGAAAVGAFSDTGAIVVGLVSPPSATFGAGEPSETGLTTTAGAEDLFLAKYYPYPAAPTPTTTTLSASPNPSAAGQAVTFTATVSAAGAGTPAGTVTFLDSATTMGTGLLNASGVATLTTSSLAVGSNSITASYGGDANFTASTSAVLTQTVNQANDPPRCAAARANPALLWPPNHKLVPVRVGGVTDPDNDTVAITIIGVTQDEPVNGLGDGDTSPDAVLQGDSVLLRAERAGGGNGRVYAVHFTADDGRGGRCAGVVRVGVPPSMKPGVVAIDDGQFYDSTQP